MLQFARTHILCLITERSKQMTNNELELINLIRESENPKQVGEYMLNLFLDYLHTHAPSQEKPVVAPQEFA
jgi:hypothetical protein